jgi:predicted phosphoribosyltransferase
LEDSEIFLTPWNDPRTGQYKGQECMDNLIEDPELRGKTGVFPGRAEAGKMLADRLWDLIEPTAIVLAIPMGGIPVACAVARQNELPLDVLVARKIPIPGNIEAGFGAIGPDGEVLLHERILEDLKLTAKEINTQVDETRRILKQRTRRFRKKRSEPDLKDRQVVLVDDGLATGYTMLAAVEYVRLQEASHVLVAVPTASQRTVHFMLPQVDMLVCLNIRGGPVFAVADAYEEWFDLDEGEAVRMLFETQGKEKS